MPTYERVDLGQKTVERRRRDGAFRHMALWRVLPEHVLVAEDCGASAPMTECHCGEYRIVWKK